MTTCWDVVWGTSLNDMLTWCLERRRVDRLLVVARLDQDAAEPVLSDPEVKQSVRRIFAGKILSESFASKWPGTELYGFSAKVYVIAFDASVKETMVAAESTLRGWIHDCELPLPEDISVFRDGDPLPTLVSVTLSGNAWIFDDGPVPRALATKAEIPLPSDLLPPPPFYSK